MNLIARYFFSFILTFFIEFVIIYLFIRKEPTKLLLYSLIITAFTLPLATYLYLNVINNFFLIEGGVVLTESLLLMLLLKIEYSKAIIISLSANLVTAMISFLFFI